MMHNSELKDAERDGPLSQFIDNCKHHRVESIYNREYHYIKEIIWDDVSQEKYGSSRAGYDEYKKNTKGQISYSGELDLRVVSINGEPISYFTETKRTQNTDLNEIQHQYQLAKEETMRIINVVDIDNFNYWLSDKIGFQDHLCANSIISNIKYLEKIIIDYQSNDKFRKYLDKIKG